jgi:heme/copper-type cytochrome/quinol oxidase subunit 4
MNNAITGLLLIITLSGLAAWWIAAHKVAERPVKVMIFVGYFWLLAFVQLSVAAIAYFVWQHYLAPIQ